LGRLDAGRGVPGTAKRRLALAAWPDEFETLLRRHCRFLEPDAEIDPDALLTSLGVDSIEVVEMIVLLEDLFGFTFPHEALTPEVFASAGSIWRTVRPLIPDEVARW
jgi:acyl carrier protein